MMNQSHIEQLEQEQDQLRQQITELPDDLRQKIYSDLKHELKDPDTYAALNYTLVAGLHHFYLGKIGRAVTELGFLILGIVVLILGFGLGWVFIAGVIMIELFELFRSQVVVFQYNNELIKQKLKDYSLHNSR